MSKSNKTGIYKYEPLWGQWEIDSLIGKGSYGEVYKVFRNVEGQRIESAAKFISIPKDDEERETLYLTGEATDKKTFKSICDSRAQAFFNEIVLMTKLKECENIVGYEAHSMQEKNDEIGWDIIIKMELLSPLDKYLRYNSFTLRDVICVGIDICNAIEFCHKNNVIHRDIKLSNIFLDNDGNYKLGDFGVSRMTGGKTTQGTVAGTEEYMAPEMLKFENYNKSVDVYSLGIVLYRLLNKLRNPFLPSEGVIDSALSEQAFKNRMNSKLSFPDPKYGNDELIRIILKACAYNPQDRYISAAEMAEDLRRVLEVADDCIVLSASSLENVSTVIIDDKTYEEILIPGKAKNKVASIVGAGLIVAGLAVGAIVFMNSRGTEVAIKGFPSSITMNVDCSMVLPVSTDPENVINKISYHSSNENVVKIDETGTVFAVGEGEAYNTVTSNCVSKQAKLSVVQ